jgi:hypothetical protein
MYKIIFKAITLLILTIFISGCMRVEMTVKVKKDGSGTIDIMMTLKKDFKDLLSGFLGDNQETEETEKKDFLTEDDMKDMESKLGNVKLVSYKKIDDDNNVGAHTVYSFENINDISTMTDMSNDETGNDISFQIIKNGKSSVLNINMPPQKDNAVKAGDKKDITDQEKQMLDMMKMYFKDFYVSMKVKVDGKIKNSNAKRIDGSTVTLIDMDLNSIISDDNLFRSFYEGTNQGIFQDYGNIKGMFYDSQKTIKIEFE